MQKGLRSALSIAEDLVALVRLLTEARSSTWVGGEPVQDGPGAAPKSFSGPMCRRPTDGKPLVGQCGTVQLPKRSLQSFYVKDSAVCRFSADLHLFDDKGVPTPSLKPVLKRVILDGIRFPAEWTTL